MRVVIHADASRGTGTGHVIRSLALAGALRRAGHEVLLATEGLAGDLAERAARARVQVVERGAAPTRGTDWLVIDGYDLTPTMGSSPDNPDVKRLVLDDLGARVGEAALVLNQNLYAGPAGPTQAPDGELLAGPTYALLDAAYANAPPPRAQPRVVNRILVTMGGSDPQDASSVALDAVRRLRPRPEVRLIIGSAHRAPGSLARVAVEDGVEVVRNASTLVEHLAWADLTVTACGSTVLEAACMGRPIVGLVVADNQVKVASAVEREGLGIVAGRHPSLDPARLCHAIEGLMSDQDARVSAAVRGPALVDGRGAGRVEQAMRTGPLRLRLATRQDADVLLDWRNDPAARSASLDSDPIQRPAHLAWLGDRLRDPAHRIWIGEIASGPIGSVRFAIDGGVATVSVVVAPGHRGCGLGIRLIAAGCARVAETGLATAVDAWIRPENSASIAAFRSVGFRPAESHADRQRYRLDLLPLR